MISILVIEQNNALRRQIVSCLKDQGYSVSTLKDSAGAIKQTEGENADIIIGNIDDGILNLCRDLRDRGGEAAVIAISSSDDISTIRRIYNSGADEYMLMPLNIEELKLRISHILWRMDKGDRSVIKFGQCELHCATGTLEAPGITIELRRIELLLLEKLIRSPGRIFSRAQLMDDIWGVDCVSSPRTVDTHIKQLRKKLRSVDSIKIQTIRGIGYRAAVPKRYKGFSDTKTEFE